MPGTADNYWPTVRAQRIALADQVGGLDPAAWDSPSWCDGWRVRDALGHLVHIAEATQFSQARDILRNGIRLNTALSRCAVAYGALPVPDLCDRLRAAADGRFRAPGLRRGVVLAEVVVHGSDMLRPLGLDLAVPVDQLPPLLNIYFRLGRVAFGARTPGAVRLVATDCDWSRGGGGRGGGARGGGDEVRGRAVDLLLLLANRRQVVPVLEGPGLAHLNPAAT
jgi:uncharacterized protein (TIGR03083 family)